MPRQLDFDVGDGTAFYQASMFEREGLSSKCRVCSPTGCLREFGALR